MACYIFIVISADFVFMLYFNITFGNGLYIHWHKHQHTSSNAVAESLYPFARFVVWQDNARPRTVAWQVNVCPQLV